MYVERYREIAGLFDHRSGIISAGNSPVTKGSSEYVEKTPLGQIVF